MNERIEKLAFEAGLKWKAQPPHYTNTNNPIDFPVSANRDLEKFAELIVKECAKIAGDAAVDTDFIKGISDADKRALSIAVEIKNYFGVK